MVHVAMMAAIVFVATYFFKFEIITPTGPVMVKTANILCLLSGMLFGGLYGGLSAGIGSMMFDLLDPKYAATAPFTLCFFFLMAAVCGWISHGGGANGKHMARNLFGAIAGALTYFILNGARNILTIMIANDAFVPLMNGSMPAELHLYRAFIVAVVANSTKLIVSAINLVVGIAGAMAIQPLVYEPLRKAGVLNKL